MHEWKAFTVAPASVPSEAISGYLKQECAVSMAPSPIQAPGVSVAAVMLVFLLSVVFFLRCKVRGAKARSAPPQAVPEKAQPQQL